MYANGRVPLDGLVHLGGDHYLPAGTAARWRWMQRAAREKYGVELRITPGWNGYRPYDIQVQYRKELGIYAATPGTSSHGGTFQGVEMFAIDVDNWAELGWGRFAALCRLAGLITDFVSPRELWHVGDRNNVWAVPAGMEDDVSATEVWQYPVRREGGPVQAIQELADAKTNTIQIRDALAPVNRGGKAVTVRQEIADAKTNTIHILAEVKALSAAVQALALSQGADPAAILKAVQDGVTEALRGISFTADIDD